MKRIISHDFISRYELVKHLVGVHDGWRKPFGYTPEDEVINFPAADVVEVVRCRECEYRDYDDEPYGKKVAVCTGAMAYSKTPDDWYCPVGKRKDGGQDK